MASKLSPPENAQPLLEAERDSLDIELSELTGERTPEIHYSEPNLAASNDQKPPWLIALTLFITVLGFTINTEATAYFEDVLKYKKPFAILYVTHSSLALPWFCHLAYLRFRNRRITYGDWVRNYNNDLRGSISTIDAYATSGPQMLGVLKRGGQQAGPLDFLATTMGLITVVLTVSGCSWFVSLALTTPSDLTAIYNCATFFAAIFSVPILKEKLGRLSIAAVALSLCGTFIIAYGDVNSEKKKDASGAAPDDSGEGQVGTSRLLGNLIACVGAVAFGLYEVLMKKWASPSRRIPGHDNLPLTLAASALTGLYTFCTLWVALLFLHIFQFEVFELPSLRVAMWIIISVLSGATSITLLVVLVVWTDPIFGSMANVLSVFTVAIADWFVFGVEPSLWAYVGGIAIIVACFLLAWDTFRGGHH